MLIRTVWRGVVLEGEPGGGAAAPAAVADPPSAPAAPAAAPSAPADDDKPVWAAPPDDAGHPAAPPAATEAPKDAAPAVDDKGEPAAPKQEDPPADDGKKPDEPAAPQLPELPDDTVANLIEAYGERWRDNPKFKAWVTEEATKQAQAQVQELQRQPESDAAYQALTSEAHASLTTIAEMAAKMDAGEEVDAKDLAGHVTKYGEFEQTAERRAGVKSAENVLTQLVINAYDGKRPPDDDPVHAAVDELRKTYAEAQQNVHRLRNSDKPENRKKWAAEDQAARDAYYQGAMKIVFDVGERLGGRKASTKAQKEADAKIALSKDATLQQALAMAAAGEKSAAGNGVKPAGGGGVMSYEQYSKLSQAEADKLTPEQINQITAAHVARRTREG